MNGYQKQNVEEGDIEYDAERRGVWIGNDVFLPRKVVIWAFQAIAAEKETNQDRGQ